MTQVPGHIKDRINEVVVKCIVTAQDHFHRFYDIPSVDFDCRGRKAGYARGDQYISLNPILLMENVEEYINQVIPHELAHCIDSANGDNQRPAWHMRNGRRIKRSIHGPTWKHIMRLFGLQPDRCHGMDTTNAAVRVKEKFEYQCITCKSVYKIGGVRHRKQQEYARVNNGVSMYTCNKCGRIHGGLEYINHVPAPKKAVNIIVPLSPTPPGFAEQMGVNIYERAKKIYTMYHHEGRQATLEVMTRLDIKATTASSYYAKLNRK